MVATGPIRILCVEDHPVFREGLRAMIGSEPDMEFVGHAPNGVEAIAQFRLHRPDITLMDLRLKGANGTDVLISIRGEFPQARIIMLTTSDGDADIQRAMRAGASAYALKSMPLDELLGVIRAVHAGRRHIPPEVAARTCWSIWATTISPPVSWKCCISSETAFATNRSPTNSQFQRIP